MTYLAGSPRADDAAPFVGRTLELALLDQTLAAIEQGEPRAVEIAGPAGIGKTRLLAELTQRADERGHIVLAGAGGELEQDLPFWVFVDALDEYVEAADPGRLERLDAAVRDELAAILPALAGGRERRDSALHERYRTHRAVRELLSLLAATRPLVLILDDFHWADQASVDLLVGLLHRPPAASVLLAVAARPHQLAPRLVSTLDRIHREGTMARLALDALSRDDARELVGARVDAIYAESGGNPFYLEQLARTDRAAALGGADVELAGLEVPPQVAAALTEELSLLDDTAQKVLDGASVAGDPFELDLVAVAADLPESEVLDAIDALLAAYFVRPTDMPRRFRFRHPIVRRAVYEATRGGWRIGAHERVTAALAARGASATALAHHVERCARHGDTAAIATLQEAGAATASRAPATAARWFDAALRLLPDGQATQRVELLLASAQARVATGEFSAGHAALLESLETVPADAAVLRTSVVATCARVEHLLGLHERAHERLMQALEELPDEPTPEAVSLMVELSLDGEDRMQYGSMIEWAERAAGVAAGLDDPALHAVAVAAAARGRAVAGDVRGATRWCDEAAAVIDALPDRVLASGLMGITMLSAAELFLHRFAAAHAHVERAITLGRATGQGQQFPQLFAFLGISWYLQGELRVAVDPLDAAVEAARLTGHAQTLAWSLYARSLVALALGDVAGALSAAQEAVDAVDDGKPNHHAAYSALALAEASLEMGKAAPIVELLERTSGGPDMPLAAASFRASFLERLTRARLMGGDVEAAARAAEAAQACAQGGDLPFRQAEANRASAAVALHTGDPRRAAELALSAAELNTAVGACMESSRSLILAGRALAACGERERARELLEQAARDLDQRGAVRYRDAAERELRALGHRVHRRSQPVGAGRHGLEALTRRELEIARRLVDRQTNRDIAAEFFLSPKTVETHIRNIFAKLGAESRLEVAQIVERADRRTGNP